MFTCSKSTTGQFYLGGVGINVHQENIFFTNLTRTMDLPQVSTGRRLNLQIMAKILLAILIGFLTCDASSEDISDPSDCPSELHWKPLFYSIEIATDIYKNGSAFRGEVTIDGMVTKDTYTLFLHSQVNVTEAFYELQGISTEIDLDESIVDSSSITLALNETLLQGVQLRLTLKFNGEFGDKRGLYLSHYKSANGSRRILSTDFQPIGARSVFPCVDLPRFKASFELKVARPENLTALSNMPLKSTSPPKPEIGGQVWDMFFPTPVMSTYLLSFVLCDDYAQLPLKSGDSIWYPKGLNKSVEYLAEIIPPLFDALKTLTGINYTLPKLDHVVIPDKIPIAMENWGLINYRYNFIELQEFNPDPRKELVFVLYVAHEIIHQWVGNLVTCKYWCHLWLNEGLTTYMSHKIVQQVFPKSNAMELFIVESLWDVMVDDFIIPVSLVEEKSCCEQNKIPWSPSYTTYNKGASILHMIENMLMTNETFKTGIMKYLQENQYGSVIDNDLWKALVDQMEEKVRRKFPEGLTMDKLMETWTHNKGYPVLNVYRHNYNGSVAIKQEKFKISQFPEDKTETWWVPLTYTTSRDKNFKDPQVKEWLMPNDEIQTLGAVISEEEWIIFNIQHAGFYKINYDPRTWELIIDHLLQNDVDDIHFMNRAQLLNDAFALAYKGALNYSVALNLSRYLKKEFNYYPFSTGLASLGSVMATARTLNVHKPVKKYFRYIIYDVYKHIVSKNFEPRDLVGKMFNMKTVSFGCQLDLEHCKRMALQVFYSIKNNNISEKQILPELRLEFWRSASKFGNMEIFNYIKNKYIENKNTKMGEMYFTALQYVREKEVIESFLRDILFNADYLKGKNKDEMIKNLARPETACPIVDFYINNYKSILDAKVSANITYHFEAILSASATEDCFHKIKLFCEENSINSNPNTNNKWATAYGKDVEKWFETQNFTLIENQEDFTEDPIVPNKFLIQEQLDIYKTE